MGRDPQKEINEFFQTGPRLETNQFTGDDLLQSFCSVQIPKNIFKEITPGLSELGAKVIGEYQDLSDKANASDPFLTTHDSWGKRIDRITLNPAWEELHRVAAREGVVATAYERKHGEFSRLHQAIRLYLYHPISAFASCPMAMTDGAAHTMETLGEGPLCEEALHHLTSRDPEAFWTSGQWMTERSGGSDVGRTETKAVPDGDRYFLYGTKFFTSAATSQTALALARIEGAVEGSRGLSLFYVPLHQNQLQEHAQILRLKDKLGTNALPTAEFTLNGIPAHLIGEPNKGVKNITGLLTMSRFYNTVCSTAAIRRLYALALDYSQRREAFGKTLDRHPLHVEILGQVKVQLAVATHLTFHGALLLGRKETNKATPEDVAILRLLIPLIKLYTGKQAMACTSELLEVFGGAGYMEDTGLPLFHRDSQVFSLWEGTTNILSLDALRAIEKTDSLKPFLKVTSDRVKSLKNMELREAGEKVLLGLQEIENYFKTHASKDPELFSVGARQLAFSLTELFAAGLLLEQADKEGTPRSVDLALMWCGRQLVSLLNLDKYDIGRSRGLLF